MRAQHRPERPPAFTYGRHKRIRSSGVEMYAEGIPLVNLAEQYGTPLYVYSGTMIRERYHQFDQAFRNCPHTICYSVKANSNLAILRLLASLGAGFDVVSGGELLRVRKIGVKTARNVVFSGVGKLAEEIDLALRSATLMFNVESASELELLAARAINLRKVAQFAVRVNPDVTTHTHPYISTGSQEHKFGVSWREAPALYRRGAEFRQLKACGVSVHIGSQITEVKPFRLAMDRVASLVRLLRSQGHKIRWVDAGGGLGIPYKRDPRLDFAAAAKRYAIALHQPLKSLGVHLLLEPGRAIIGPAGLLLTRVVYRKDSDGKRFIVVDAAMNDLLRPSLYGAYHEIVPVRLREDNPPPETVDIVGPICETGDYFAREREIRRPDEGDLLAILDAGAYGMALASNYNTRPRPAEVLVEGRRSRLIRRRESVRDLLGPECV